MCKVLAVLVGIGEDARVGIGGVGVVEAVWIAVGVVEANTLVVGVILDAQLVRKKLVVRIVDCEGGCVGGGVKEAI